MKRYLILEDGSHYEGIGFGSDNFRIGELVFNTSMTGYQEILSDLSYCGQITVMTYPLIGNYGINRDDERYVSNMTLSQAIRILVQAPENLKRDFLNDCMNIALSDDYCARTEALIIVSLLATMTDKLNVDADVVSVEHNGLTFENAQMLYVESSEDELANKSIRENYREIISESRLAGFDFVYLPQISEHYRSISHEQLLQIISFLYPSASENRLNMVIDKLLCLSTSEFCKEQLSTKLTIHEMYDVQPSLFIKIGETSANDKEYANFLILGLDNDAINTIRLFIDTFSTLFRSREINYLREERGRFVYAGFYKQILDIHMLQKGIISSILIDTIKEEISFPDADVKVDKLHRREKALYALLILESESGGINFSKPKSAKLLERYNRRMATIMRKYGMIYEKFGGDRQKVPNIEIPEIRLPMFALIKRQIMKLDGVLSHAEDYLIKRNIYGNYCINVNTSLCLFRSSNDADAVHAAESEFWSRIVAL